VHRGGWSGPNFDWYVGTLSHNTVVKDGTWQAKGAGKTVLWIDEPGFRAIRTLASELYPGGRYERTIAMVDISAADFYLVDVFRVSAGREHCKFMHSHFGQLTTQGLALQPAEDYGHGALMRHFQADLSPQPGWSVDWQIEDRLGYLAPGADVHLRCIDFTTGAQAYVAEAWVSVGGFTSNQEAWIQRLMVRRCAAAEQEPASFQTTFVSIIEPYTGRSNIAQALRLTVPVSDSHVCLEVTLADGRRDLMVLADPEADDEVRLRALLQDGFQLRVSSDVTLKRSATA
jgi:hypothetical protein